MIDWSISRPIGQSINWLFDQLLGWSIGQLVNQPIYWLVHLLIGQLMTGGRIRREGEGQSTGQDGIEGGERRYDTLMGCDDKWLDQGYTNNRLLYDGMIEWWSSGMRETEVILL